MPDLTVIEGGGPPKEQSTAEYKVRLASRQLAANILRIIRGAGKPEALVDQMKALLDAGFDYQDVTGHWPIDTIAGSLRIESEYSRLMRMAERGEVDEARINRMRERRMIAEDNIRRGALQAIASRLVGQELQEASGDRDMRDRIERLISIAEEPRTSKAPTKAKDPR